MLNMLSYFIFKRGQLSNNPFLPLFLSFYIVTLLSEFGKGLYILTNYGKKFINIFYLSFDLKISFYSSFLFEKRRIFAYSYLKIP